MSNAWEGYERLRRGSRRRRKLRWRLAFMACVLAAGSLVGLSRCLPQGVFNVQSFGAAGAAGNDADPAALAVVVYNENDPLSRDLAGFYAEKRGIPAERVISLKCPTDEEITREQYDETIAGPLRAQFDAHGWWTRTPDRPDKEPSSVVRANRIRFLVLMRGIPLRIRQTAAYPGDFCNQPPPIRDANGASVDSELAVLGLFTRGISGLVPNPYFGSFHRITETNFPGLLLTGRLDAPTGSTVRQMILDSLAAEKYGLWGRCYLDGRGIVPGSGPTAAGDEWIAKIARDRAPYFLPTISDQRPETFSAAYPMRETAMYFGWYAQDMAGPFTRDDFRFIPGAVACHIHSFSATSLRDPVHWWVGPLLNKGAAAVLGNVYEPFLTLTTHLDIFVDRLFDGFTLAESAWAATPGLLWMNIVAGDPLYRPGLYWKNQEFSLDAPAVPPGGESALAAEGRAYWQGAQIWRSNGSAAGAAALQKSGARLHSGRIFEGLASLEASLDDVPLARHAFEQAAHEYADPADAARVMVDEARFLARNGRKTEASELLAVGRRKFAGKPALAALDEAAAEITPAAAPVKP